MENEDELKFYDLKSAAESALIDLKENCDKIGRDWKEEIEDIVADLGR